MAPEKIRNGSGLCSNRCGFYGNPATGGLCSQCHRNSLNEQETKGSEAPVAHVVPDAAAPADPMDWSSSLASTTSATACSKLALATRGVDLSRAFEESSSSPKLCASHCGFYGTAATGGLCSACYRDPLKRKETRTPDGSVPQIEFAAASAHSVISSSTSESTVSAPPGSGVDGRCTNGCGRHGTAGIGGLCSRCFMDLLQKKPTKRPESFVAQIDVTTTTIADSVGASATASRGADLSARGRCASCNKKLGLLKGFPCKCGNAYCAAHRYAEQHECAYDYKSAGRAALEKKNPVVKSDKLQKF